MIKKIIAAADVHISNDQKPEEVHEVFGAFISQVEEIVNENEPGETIIVLAGDIYDNHVRVTNEGNVKVGWFLRSLSRIAPTYIICGNHDLDYSNLEKLDDISCYMMVAKPENITYLDKELNYASGCYNVDNIVFNVYSHFSNFERPDIEQAKKDYPGCRMIGLIHGDISGAVNDKGFSTDTGLEKNIFKGNDWVIAGHIHKFQELKYGKVPIVYCSSIKQQNFGENISGHGFVVWDVESGTYEFKEVENPNYNYYTFEFSNPDDIDNELEKLINA